MSFQSTNIWARGYSYILEAAFGIVAFCGFMVVISLVHSIINMVKKQQTFTINKLSFIFFIVSPIIITISLIFELGWRINAFYGVSTFYVSYWWHYLMFTAINYLFILVVWIIKNLYTKRFSEYRKEFIGIKVSIFMFYKRIISFIWVMCKKIKNIILNVYDYWKKIIKQLKHFIFKSWFKPQKTKILDVVNSPAPGKIIALKKIVDKAFSQGHLGQGFGVVPELKTNLFVAPINGVIETIFYGNHAYVIKSNNETSVLVHIGINTIQLQSKYFNALKKIGEKVKMGDPIIQADLKKIQAAGYDITTIVICTLETKGKININKKHINSKVNINNNIIKIS